MINLLPEPKLLRETGGETPAFRGLAFGGADAELADVIRLRFWNYPDLPLYFGEGAQGFLVRVLRGLDAPDLEANPLFASQGYRLDVGPDGAVLRYVEPEGFVHGVTSLKMLLRESPDGFTLPLCAVTDWPSVPVRAVAPTFSWYAGYGRIGFDMQLWGYEEWAGFLNVCLDSKINQFNMVMYGYWPFEFEEYPETVFRGVPVKIWNA
ncbi:MAG TPA: glycoside hydrolase family 20 zincin-like fold domain-containing protein [Candidatus Limnocylindria bacterium]|nr:glycoside hydrolase family 20 zincin-like fold domain-containing protein [Candidatus Limnocylindria bacterium]